MFKILSVCRGGGYMYCRTNPPHPKRNSKGLYPLHRVIAENNIGRLLDKREHAHHIDGDKENNTPQNISVLTCSDHSKIHNPKVKDSEMVRFFCSCGKEIIVKPHIYRLRIKRNKSNFIYCSRSCGSKSTSKLRCSKP